MKKKNRKQEHDDFLKFMEMMSQLLDERDNPYRQEEKENPYKPKVLPGGVLVVPGVTQKCVNYVTGKTITLPAN